MLKSFPTSTGVKMGSRFVKLGMTRLRKVRWREGLRLLPALPPPLLARIEGESAVLPEIVEDGRSRLRSDRDRVPAPIPDPFFEAANRIRPPTDLQHAAATLVA